MRYAEALEQQALAKRIDQLQKDITTGANNVIESAVTSINMVLSADAALKEMQKDYESRENKS